MAGLPEAEASVERSRLQLVLEVAAVGRSLASWWLQLSGELRHSMLHASGSYSHTAQSSEHAMASANAKPSPAMVFSKSVVHMGA